MNINKAIVFSILVIFTGCCTQPRHFAKKEKVIHLHDGRCVYHDATSDTWFWLYMMSNNGGGGNYYYYHTSSNSANNSPPPTNTGGAVWVSSSTLPKSGPNSVEKEPTPEELKEIEEAPPNETLEEEIPVEANGQPISNPQEEQQAESEMEANPESVESPPAAESSPSADSSPSSDSESSDSGSSGGGDGGGGGD